MSVDGSVWAVVPVKAFRLAKQRLAGAFSPFERRALAEAMLDDVLSVLARVESLAGILVVTRDSLAAARARRRGALVLHEPEASGLNAAVAVAASQLSHIDCAAMLVLHGDVPGVTVDEVQRLIATRRDGRSFTLVPAHDGGGTNAVLLSLPQAVQPFFGENSFERNVRAARAAGLQPAVLRLPGIGLDLDRPEDVQAYLSLHPTTRSGRWLRARERIAIRAGGNDAGTRAGEGAGAGWRRQGRTTEAACLEAEAG